MFEADGFALGEDPCAVGDERHGGQSPEPFFCTADFVDPFGAKYAKTVEKGVLDEVVGIEKRSALQHGKEHGADAAEGLGPLRQADEEGRDEVEAEKDVDVPQEGGFAPSGIEQEVAQRMAEVGPGELDAFERTGEQGHDNADEQEGDEELAEFAPDVAEIAGDAVDGLVGVAD